MTAPKKSDCGSETPRRAHRVMWPPVLIATDLSELLGLQNARAARAFVVRHGIPYVKAGRTLLVVLESLVAWLREHEMQGDPDGDALRAAADRLSLGQREMRDRAMSRIARRRK